MNTDSLSVFMCLFNMISISFPFSLVYVSMYIDTYFSAGGGGGNCLRFLLKLCRVLFQIESP